MKAKTAAYWIATGVVATVMTISGVLSLLRRMPFTHLGYPTYFAYILGVAKLLGVCALLVPGWVVVKEWAYAGFGITLISAIVSHFASGDGLVSLDPLFFFIMLTVSYLTRPAGRRLIPSGRFVAVANTEGAR
ncbi:MAG TPA: DoxX family protein [Acidobacteriaceae bacterium]